MNVTFSKLKKKGYYYSISYFHNSWLLINKLTNYLNYTRSKCTSHMQNFNIKLKIYKKKRNINIYILPNPSNTFNRNRNLSILQNKRKLCDQPSCNDNYPEKNRNMANTWVIYKINLKTRNKTNINNNYYNMAKNPTSCTSNNNSNKTSLTDYGSNYSNRNNFKVFSSTKSKIRNKKNYGNFFNE